MDADTQGCSWPAGVGTQALAIWVPALYHNTLILCEKRTSQIHKQKPMNGHIKTCSSISCFLLQLNLCLPSIGRELESVILPLPGYSGLQRFRCISRGAIKWRPPQSSPESLTDQNACLRMKRTQHFTVFPFSYLNGNHLEMQTWVVFLVSSSMCSQRNFTHSTVNVEICSFLSWRKCCTRIIIRQIIILC